MSIMSAMCEGGETHPNEKPATAGHVIDFNLDGSVQAMHNDKFNLGFLGQQRIERATEIKFCEDCQTWGIFLPTPADCPPEPFQLMVDEAARGFKEYEVARKVEVAWLNACRLADVKPASYTGIQILQSTRRALGH